MQFFVDQIIIFDRPGSFQKRAGSICGSQFDAKTGEVIRWTKYTGSALAAVKALKHPPNLKTYQTSIQNEFLYITDEDFGN